MIDYKNITVDEKFLKDNYSGILELLLKDNTTQKNIIWATDLYKKFGYKFKDNINKVVFEDNNFIIPRSQKNRQIQVQRSKDNAEVFTPSWVCNKQNNLIDNEWFGVSNLFNYEIENGWRTNNEKIAFPCNKTWKDYIDDIRLEITCGEAPYIVSRYDSVSGDLIPINNRIGLLDRKFRVLNENAQDEEEWLNYSFKAIKSVYGYEWQGDNLILARENVLFSYFDYYLNKFNRLPELKLIKEITMIITWNLWQMDGIKGVIPKTCENKSKYIVNLLGEKEKIKNSCLGCHKNNIFNHNGIYSKVMDWENNKKIRFIDLLPRGYQV